MGKYIAIWDADVIIDSSQIVEAMNLLRGGTADVVFPYDGHFYDTTDIIRSVFLENGDISILKEHIGKMQQPYGLNMGGERYSSAEKNLMRLEVKMSHFMDGGRKIGTEWRNGKN